MNQAQPEGSQVSNIVWMDPTVSYKDRNSGMRVASLLYRKGLPALALDQGGRPYVAFADDLGKTLAVPLTDARYLSDASPARV